jgi:LmbE family N-acetylglucosaminyl deacetylase/CheY-like chemotaxis protein
MLNSSDAPDPQPVPWPRETRASLEARPHILVVEDDAAMTEVLRGWLERGRYRVTFAPTSEEAIRQLSALQLDGLICDVDLVETDGFEILRLSKSIRPLVPVMMITADITGKAASSALRNHADDMLIKPFEADELLQRLEEIVVTGRIARRAGTRTVLAVSAHPDDAEIGIAGTLLDHVARGDRVIHLIMTDGEGGGARADRIAEAECAAECMGVSLRRASLPDGCIADTMDTVAAIEAIIGECGPSMLYTHSEHDRHQDHRTTHHVAMVAARSVPYVYAYQAPSSTVDFRPTRFVDIERHLERKIEILKLYHSQARIRLYLADDLIRATARYWGRFAGHRIVEPLEVVRQLSQ